MENSIDTQLQQQQHPHNSDSATDYVQVSTEIIQQLLAQVDNSNNNSNEASKVTQHIEPEPKPQPAKRASKRKNDDKENVTVKEPAVANKRKRGVVARKLNLEASPDLQTKEKESLFGNIRTPLRDINNNNIAQATASAGSSQSMSLRMTCEADLKYDYALNNDLPVDYTLHTFQVNTSHIEQHHLNQLARFNQQQQQSFMNMSNPFVDMNNNNIDNSGGVLNTPTDINSFITTSNELLNNYAYLTAPENFLCEKDELGITVFRAQNVNNQPAEEENVPPQSIVELTVPPPPASTAANRDDNDSDDDFFGDNQELEEQHSRSEKVSTKNDVFFEGRNLSRIEGATSGVYAYNVAKVLFTEDELDKGTIPSETARNQARKRTALDSHRSMILREAVCNKFSIGPSESKLFWNDVRTKLNSKLCKKSSEKLKKATQNA